MRVSALVSDLYELTMTAGYHASGQARATFELFVRELPPTRSFLIAAGIDQALEYLEPLAFAQDEIAYLRSVPALGNAPASFFDDYLARFRFTGEVWAVAEGTLVFAQQPLLRVTAPVGEAQIVETALLSIVGFQTSVASKAARVVAAAEGRPVVEFGSRRAHGPEAARYAARAAYLAGCASTSNVEAGFLFGIPVSGTMAHSWVMSFASELDAFRTFASVHGPDSVFIIDTYDPLVAVGRIVDAGLRPSGVRLDSGDLVALSRAVRQALDAGGLRETRVFASGDLDEHRVAALLAAQAPIDAFGVGTAVSTSSDAPALGAVYKLIEIERQGVPAPAMKLSPGKRLYPGRKQIWRLVEDGVMRRDVVATADEAGPPGATPLLTCVMRGGRRLDVRASLAALRDRSAAEQLRLPPRVRQLRDGDRYPVAMSEGLERLADEVAGRIQ
ncbi:MAG: nicotinate phosphoribosyltransferase [Luteitalea sp.]|nr:nicotinate phosphoribosyltransferase [Luteitalea sp.]